MQLPNTQSRRNLLLAGAACALPSLAMSGKLQSRPLVLGLVSGSSLYAMAAQRTAKGIDWEAALSNDKLAEEKRVKTIFGSKPPRQLFAYDLLGEPLHQTVATNWTRDADFTEAGDHGFKVIGVHGLPKTYLVASEQFFETNTPVKQDLVWSEILELRARFKREVIGRYLRDTFEEGVNGGDSARALLAQADIVYTGSRVLLPNSTSVITTIQARRKKKDSYPSDIKLTWLETPGLKAVRYFSFGREETFSVEFMGVWHLPGEAHPVMIVRDINKAGVDYQIRTDFFKPSHTINLGGSGC